MAIIKRSLPFSALAILVLAIFFSCFLAPQKGPDSSEWYLELNIIHQAASKCITVSEFDKDLLFLMMGSLGTGSLWI
jgi:DNA-binding helix-hairpin-helix protein with protein kinase domain